jgi:hypothetical protein
MSKDKNHRGKTSHKGKTDRSKHWKHGKSSGGNK